MWGSTRNYTRENPERAQHHVKVTVQERGVACSQSHLEKKSWQQHLHEQGDWLKLIANSDIALALITGKWYVHTHEGFNWSQVYSIWVTGGRSPLQQQQATTKQHHHPITVHQKRGNIRGNINFFWLWFLAIYQVDLPQNWTGWTMVKTLFIRKQIFPLLAHGQSKGLFSCKFWSILPPVNCPWTSNSEATILKACRKCLIDFSAFTPPPE